VSVLLLTLVACFGPRPGKELDITGLTGLVITPDAYVVPLGGELQLVAIGVFDDRRTEDVTSAVDWYSSDTSLATVSNELDAEGVLAPRAVGELEVSASAGGVDSNTALVSITDADLVGISVEPAEITLAEGDVMQLQAVAAWSDGSRGDAARQVQWFTDDGGVAQIASGGELTAAGRGDTTIHCEWEGATSNEVPVEVVAGGGGGGSGRADLRVRGVEGVGGGGVVTLSVEIANDGDVGAGTFWVDAFLDPSGSPDVGDLGDDFVLVDYLGPGERFEFTMTLYAGTGSHEVVVFADTNDDVSESSESNNQFSGTVSGGVDDDTTWTDTTDTTWTGGGPNLQVSYFDYLADDTYLYYAVDVTNSGNEDVGEFLIDVFVDRYSAPELYQDGDDWTSVSGLDAGDTAFADFLIADWCYYCESWVLVDGYDYVDETDESDNVDGPLYVFSE